MLKYPDNFISLILDRKDIDGAEAAVVEHFLSLMDGNLQRCVLGHFREGMTHSTLAKELNCSKYMIRKNIRRAAMRIFNTVLLNVHIIHTSSKEWFWTMEEEEPKDMFDVFEENGNYMDLVKEAACGSLAHYKEMIEQKTQWQREHCNVTPDTVLCDLGLEFTAWDSLYHAGHRTLKNLLDAGWEELRKVPEFTKDAEKKLKCIIERGYTDC